MKRMNVLLYVMCDVFVQLLVVTSFEQTADASAWEDVKQKMADHVLF